MVLPTTRRRFNARSTRGALLRLVGAILTEQDDEWAWLLQPITGEFQQDLIAGGRMSERDARRARYSHATRGSDLPTERCGSSTVTDPNHMQQREERAGQFPPLDGTQPPTTPKPL